MTQKINNDLTLAGHLAADAQLSANGNVARTMKTDQLDTNSLKEGFTGFSGYAHQINIAANIAWAHHEYYNGNGYPRKLKGDEIPLCARIMSVADVYDALVSKRPYKEPYPHEVAVQEIINGEGIQFDPDVVDAFTSIADSLPELYQKFKDEGI